MKLLLDTHVLLWWLAGGERLSIAAVEAIASRDNRVQISVVSLWEIVIKVRVRKLAVDIAAVEKTIETAGFERLPITAAHLVALKTLPAPHGDPFDHLLIAQAIAEEATVVSIDRAFRNYPVELFECDRAGCGRV